MACRRIRRRNGLSGCSEPKLTKTRDGFMVSGALSMLGKVYRSVEPRQTGACQGKVSRYAWGQDYHEVIHQRLRKLADFHRQLCLRRRFAGWSIPHRSWSASCATRWAGVDRQEHALAQSPLRKLVLSGGPLSSEVLEYDEPTEVGHCGTCLRLPRRLPYGRVGRSLHAGRPAVHQLLDDRSAPVPRTRRVAVWDRRVAIRMRCLPGRLPLEKTTRRSRPNRPFSPAAAWIRPT